MAHPNTVLGEGNNPFQATYFSIAREALSIARHEEGAVSHCDVGAGNGRVAKIALDIGFLDVWGVEIDERWRRALQALHEEAEARFNFVIGDALKSMPQRRFDAIFLFNPMDRKLFARFLARLGQRKFLPRVFVQVNPEYDDLMIEAGYEETYSRSTGKHIEYKIFRRRTPQREAVSAFRPVIESSPPGRSGPRYDGAAP